MIRWPHKFGPRYTFSANLYSVLFLSFASQRVNGNLNLEWKPLIFRPRTWLKWSLSSPNEFPLKAETDFKLLRTFSTCFAVVFFSATYELFISFSFSSQLHRKRYNLFHIVCSLNYNLNNIYNKLKEVSFFFWRTRSLFVTWLTGTSVCSSEDRWRHQAYNLAVMSLLFVSKEIYKREKL